MVSVCVHVHVCAAVAIVSVCVHIHECTVCVRVSVCIIDGPHKQSLRSAIFDNEDR